MCPALVQLRLAEHWVGGASPVGSALAGTCAVAELNRRRDFQKKYDIYSTNIKCLEHLISCRNALG